MVKDITGLVFNSLTAIRYSETKNSNAYWLFKCVCGKKKVICKNNVVRKLTKTCGCTRYKVIAEKSKTHGFISKFKKGKSNPQFYAIWSGMRNRCQNKNNRSYQVYGGKGVMVDERWNTFTNFYDDMYYKYLYALKKYGSKISIDRIDNSKGYSKENCRWTNQTMQARNKTTNTEIKFNGKIFCISSFTEKYGIDRSKFYRRKKKGLSISEIHKELATK